MEQGVVHVYVSAASQSVNANQVVGLHVQLRASLIFSFFISCLSTTVDRRGESEESGDDETRRRSINGDVDPSQPPDTGKPITATAQQHLHCTKAQYSFR